MQVVERRRLRQTSPVGRPLGNPNSVLAHEVDAELLEARDTWMLVLKPAQERPDRPLVMAQCLGRDQASLLVQPEVLVGGLDRRRSVWL
jgi:hypothetical protein